MASSRPLTRGMTTSVISNWIWPECFGEVQRLDSVRALRNGVTAAAQVFADQFAHAFFVFDKQNSFGAGRWSGDDFFGADSSDFAGHLRQ